MNKQLTSFRLSDETKKKIKFILDHSFCYNNTMVIEQSIDDMYNRLKEDYIL